MERKAVKILEEGLKFAHEIFEGTMQGVEEQHASWVPSGKALPIGTLYVHLLISEDMTINMMLKGGAPLFATSFKDKTGASELMPEPGPNWESEHRDWAAKVKVDLKLAKEYAKEVYKNSEEYLKEIQDSDLEKMIDLSAFEMEEKNAGWVIMNFVIGHINNIMGEISTLKGFQGLKGYPF